MKPKKILLILILIMGFGLLIGTACLFNDIFPIAMPITIPDSAEIISINLGCDTTNCDVTVDEEDYADLILHLSAGKPTRRQALNDTPTVWPYYCIEIQAESRWYRCFVYEEGGQIYIEMPYDGIYESEMILLDLVLRYFEEG